MEECYVCFRWIDSERQREMIDTYVRQKGRQEPPGEGDDRVQGKTVQTAQVGVPLEGFAGDNFLPMWLKPNLYQPGPYAGEIEQN